MNQTDHKIYTTQSPLKDLSPQDFLAFGVQQMAYVRQVRVLDKNVFAIHAADGTPLSIVDTEDQALNAISQNELDPVRLH
jgi:hypothetical protein